MAKRSGIYNGIDKAMKKDWRTKEVVLEELKNINKREQENAS